MWWCLWHSSSLTSQNCNAGTPFHAGALFGGPWTCFIDSQGSWFFSCSRVCRHQKPVCFLRVDSILQRLWFCNSRIYIHMHNLCDLCSPTCSWSCPYHDVLSSEEIPRKPGTCLSCLFFRGVYWFELFISKLVGKPLIILWWKSGESVADREALEMDYLRTVVNKVKISKYHGQRFIVWFWWPDLYI